MLTVAEWLPLLAVRIAWTLVASCLVVFAFGQYHQPRVPRPVSLFLLAWSVVLAVMGGWLVVFDPTADASQSAWFRAALGAAFTGTLIGCFWTLLWFRRTRFCEIHHQVIDEMARRLDATDAG